MSDRLIFFLFAYLLILSVHNPVYAQYEKEKEDTEDPFALPEDYDTPLTIDLEDKEEEEVIKTKKKKRKKRVFYGLKTKRAYTKTIKNGELIIEFFHYPKEPQTPDLYVRDIYWYDFRKKKIVKSRNFDEDEGVLLHGPYRKVIDEQVLEEGIFYAGTKHGRWTRYNRNDILLDKEKYYKGWPKESLVSFYDKGRKKLKEVIPVEYGEKEGYYYYFHPNGRVAVRGEYKFDAKVGVWSEFYNRKRRRKRQVQYSEDPFDESHRPFILKEWNEYGKVIYDREREIDN